MTGGDPVVLQRRWVLACACLTMATEALAQPAPQPAPASKQQSEAEAAEPAAEERPPPDALAVGSDGLFQPSLLLQAWFVVNHSPESEATSEETSSTFRMRRAEIRAKGQIVPDLVSYAVMIDPARVLDMEETTIVVDGEEMTIEQPVSPISMLQDLFITLQSDYVDASIGRFKTPVSWEGYNSSSRLLFAERAAVSREFGDRRDMGLRFAKTFEYFGYSAGLFNGQERVQLDDNNAKDAALRLEAYPIAGLVIAGVVYTSIGDRGEPGTKDRFEGDVRYENGPFLFQGEYIRAHDVRERGEADGQGFYAALAWTFAGVIQPAVRIGHLDPDVDADLPATDSQDELLHVDVGVNCLIRKHEAKLQLNYYRLAYDDRAADDQFVFAAQVAY